MGQVFIAKMRFLSPSQVIEHSVVPSCEVHAGRDVNKARGVKAKTSKPRPETCKTKTTDPRPRPIMRK